MRSKQRVFIAGGVVATGVVAALLFRKPNVAPLEEIPTKAIVVPQSTTAHLPARTVAKSVEFEPPAPAGTTVIPAKSNSTAEVIEPEKSADLWVNPQPPDLSVRFPSDNTTSSGWQPVEHEQEARVPLRIHRVRDGDTLPTLARRYLGDAARADEILEANRDLLQDPELLPIGLELEIPNREVEREDAIYDR